jgi:DNA-directed RNA polymerase specialized sigma24 family protein
MVLGKTHCLPYLFSPNIFIIKENHGMTDGEIMQQLHAGGAVRELAWQFIYTEWRQYLLASVLQMGGSKADALSALSKVCIAFEDTVLAPDFVVKHSLKAYLGVCVKNAYLHDLQSKSNQPVGSSLDRDLEETLMVDPFFVNHDPAVATQIDLIITQAVGESCKTIIRLFAERYSYREIGEKLGKSETAAKEQKHACQAKIRTWLSQHPETKKYLKSLLHG